MTIKETKKLAVYKPSVFKRLGAVAAPVYDNSGTAVCKFWLAGNCNRKHCRFAHHLPNTYCRKPDQQPLDGPSRPNTYCRVPQQSDKGLTLSRKPSNSSSKNGTDIGDIHTSPPQPVDGRSRLNTCHRVPQRSDKDLSLTSKSCNNSSKNVAGFVDIHTSPPQSVDVASTEYTTRKKINKLCSYWAADKCTYGDNCNFIHAWSVGEDFCSMAKLEGHNKDVTGIALPSGSDKLYSASRDGSLRLWDCNTGKCAQVIDLGDEIGSLVSEGPWIFLGMPNVVKAWNVQTHAQFDLSGPVGQVYAMAVSCSDDMLFAGAQDGVILAWKGGMESSPFQELASLKGHNLPVLSLVVASKRLYSGSSDHTIRVWEITTLQCMHTLCGHSDAVMSVLCWNKFLLSCSLDQTIKIWACTEAGNLQVVYTHKEEHGVLALFGMHDADEKPILYCSCNDNSVCLYELPSFSERGRLFSKHKVRTIQVGPGGIFFTGDGIGSLSVWKWNEKSQDTNVNAKTTMCI